MKAYVEIVQRREREIGCDVLTHQKWSGANYYDRYLKTVQGGISSTAAMGKGKFFISLFCFRPRCDLFVLLLNRGILIT